MTKIEQLELFARNLGHRVRISKSPTTQYLLESIDGKLQYRLSLGWNYADARDALLQTLEAINASQSSFWA